MSRLGLVLVLGVLAAALAATPAFAATVDNGLSLAEAVELALANSQELKQAYLEVEAAKETRREAWETYNAVLLRTYIPGQDLYVSLPTGEDPQGLVYITNFNWLVKQKNYEAKKDSVIATVYKKYYGLLQEIEKIRAQELALAEKEKQLANAEARYKVGMETAVSLQGMRAEIARVQAVLAEAKNGLERTYAELAELLGLPVDSRPILTESPVYEPLRVEDPEKAIEEITENSPAVWIANEAVRLERDTYGMLHNYDVDKAELNKAKADVAVARESTRQLTRTLYYTAKSLEESCTTAQENLRLAELSLRVARLRYEVGMATQADLLAAEAALAQAKQAFLALQCQHDLLKMAFYKPWTAGVVLGTGSGGDQTATTASSQSGSSGR
ncbi:MAG: TolC family protein [Bacillota bacterium]